MVPGRTIDELMAEIEAKRNRPGIRQKIINYMDDHFSYGRYRILAWKSWIPRWFKRTIHAVPVREFIQRGRRGWADSDTWGLDSYINRVTGEALVYMVETNFGWPGEQSDWPTSEEWDAYCLTMSRDMLDWSLDWREETAEENRARFDKAQDAWYRFAKGFGHYWT